MELPALTTMLDELEWKWVDHGESTVKVQHDTSEGQLIAYIRLTDNWLIASIVPFLTTNGENSLALVRWLLRMNRDMYQSKFAIDEDGDVVLTVEVPTEALDFREVELAFTSLLKSAVDHRATLRRASGG